MYDASFKKISREYIESISENLRRSQSNQKNLTLCASSFELHFSQKYYQKKKKKKKLKPKNNDQQQNKKELIKKRKIFNYILIMENL